MNYRFITENFPQLIHLIQNQMIDWDTLEYLADTKRLTVKIVRLEEPNADIYTLSITDVIHFSLENDQHSTTDIIQSLEINQNPFTLTLQAAQSNITMSLENGYIVANGTILPQLSGNT